MNKCGTESGTLCDDWTSGDGWRLQWHV